MRERTHHFDPRQSMSSPDFEVFHYYDLKSAGVELHHHDFYEVYFLVGGQMDYRVEGRIYHLEPGDLLLISPMEFHQPVVKGAEKAYERIVLWISKAYLERCSSEKVSLTRCFDASIPTHTNLLRLSAAQRADVTLRLGELLREQGSQEYGGELYSASLLLQFLVELNRIALGAAISVEQQETSPLVTRVLEYINEYYDRTITLDKLAQQFYVSKYHLSHEFSRVVGTSVYRYVMLKRLMIAKQMLSSGVAPGTVCVNCGFPDYANFYRAFKAQYGISPRDCISGKAQG